MRSCRCGSADSAARSSPTWWGRSARRAIFCARDREMADVQPGDYLAVCIGRSVRLRAGVELQFPAARRRGAGGGQGVADRAPEGDAGQPDSRGRVSGGAGRLSGRTTIQAPQACPERALESPPHFRIRGWRAAPPNKCRSGDRRSRGVGRLGLRRPGEGSARLNHWLRLGFGRNRLLDAAVETGDGVGLARGGVLWRSRNDPRRIGDLRVGDFPDDDQVFAEVVLESLLDEPLGGL